ncbi:hypothetical protein CDR68_24595 [Salmonella enterica]|nr:hypothetical protein [Salmonella enterica]
MNINDIKELLMDDDNYPQWVNPVEVTGIDYDASKKLYKKIWYNSRSSSESMSLINVEQYDPQSEAKILLNYVSKVLSWWGYFYDKEKDRMPDVLSKITAIDIIKASIFFIQYLGYPIAGGIISIEAKSRSHPNENEEIFHLYKSAFETESEPHLKWCLQDNFLEFFGYIPNFDDVYNDRNWNGLSEQNLAYLNYLHKHRITEPLYESL